MSTLRRFREKPDDLSFLGRLGFYFLLTFGAIISVFPFYWMLVAGTNDKPVRLEFFWPLVVLQNKEHYMTLIALQQLFTTRDGLDYGMIISAGFTALLPLLIVFLLFSRRVIAGLTSGTIKS